MVSIDTELSISQEIDTKLSQCVFYGKEFLVMHWIITLSCFQLTRLVAEDALCAICIKLHERTADRKIAGVKDHVEWSALICNLQNGRLHQALLDTLKRTLIVIVSLPLHIFLE